MYKYPVLKFLRENPDEDNTIKFIGEKLNLTEKQVICGIRQLEQMKLVDRKRMKGFKARYIYFAL